jgi:hypothetical protein
MVTHTRIFESDLEKVNSIRDQCGFRGSAWVIHSLLESQAENIATVEAIMKDRVPVVLTGKPLSGKSYFVKNKLLPSLTGSPVLVIDVQNEYDSLRKIGFDIFGLDFENFTDHIRFMPNSQSMVAESEIASLFSNLEMKRETLSKWTIIIEEGQAFKTCAPFVRFLYGSRHIVRKMVVVTPQTDSFLGLFTLRILR